MLKKMLLCAVLAFQFAVVSSVAADWPVPSCSPENCPHDK